MKIPKGWREGRVEDLQRKLAAAERRNDELTEGIRVNNEALAVMQQQRDEAESAISRYEVRVAELERLCDKAQAARGMAEKDRAEMAARLATLEDRIAMPETIKALLDIARADTALALGKAEAAEARIATMEAAARAVVEHASER